MTSRPVRSTVQPPTSSMRGVLEAEAHIDAIAEMLRLAQGSGTHLAEAAGDLREVEQVAFEQLKNTAAGTKEYAKALAKVAAIEKSKPDVQAGAKTGLSGQGALASPAPTHPLLPKMAVGLTKVTALLAEVLRNASPAAFERGDTPAQDAIRFGGTRLLVANVARMVLAAIGMRRTPRSAASVKRAIDQRAGPLFELLIPYFSNVTNAEQEAAQTNASGILSEKLAEVLQNERSQRIGQVLSAIANRMSAVGSDANERLIVDEGNSELSNLEDGPIGEGLWLVSLSRMRTVEGLEGSDHFRAIFSIETDAKTGESFIDLRPVELASPSSRRAMRRSCLSCSPFSRASSRDCAPRTLPISRCELMGPRARRHRAIRESAAGAAAGRPRTGHPQGGWKSQPESEHHSHGEAGGGKSCKGSHLGHSVGRIGALEQAAIARLVEPDLIFRLPDPARRVDAFPTQHARRPRATASCLFAVAPFCPSLCRRLLLRFGLIVIDGGAHESHQSTLHSSYRPRTDRSLATPCLRNPR